MSIVKVPDFERLLIQALAHRLGGLTIRLTDVDFLLQCLDEGEKIQVLHQVLRVFLQSTKQQIVSQIKTEREVQAFWEQVRTRCVEFTTSHSSWVRYPPSLAEMHKFRDRQGMLVAMHLGLVHVLPK